MQQLVTSVLVKNFITVLNTDIKCVMNDSTFACRPLTGYTSEKDIVIGRFKGKIGLAQTNQFKASLEELVTDWVRKVILDLAEVSLSKSAIGVLLAFTSAMHGRNKRLYLYKTSTQILQAFDELAITNFFLFLETEDDILASFVV